MPNFLRHPLVAAVALVGAGCIGVLYSDVSFADSSSADSSVDSSYVEPGAADSGSADSASTNSAEKNSPDENGSWLDNARNLCAQQYSVEQCQDEEFLEQNFHVRDLQTAHRAATRRNELERRALQELLLQRTCGKPATYCAINATPDCATQLQQMCASIQQQAATCQKNAALYCATTGQSSNCLKQRQALCPTAKKQTIDKLLAKYPRLTLQQQAHVRQVAQQIDANQNNWIGNLFRWFGF
jgi:hypothetical protein